MEVVKLKYGSGLWNQLPFCLEAPKPLYSNIDIDVFNKLMMM